MTLPLTPRIAPGKRRDVGLPIWIFSKLAARQTKTNPPHIFLTLGRNKGLFWGWLHFAGRLMPGGKLPRRETELVILRVAGTRGSDYELTQHRAMGRKVGLSENEVARAESGDNTGWSEQRATLLAATDELLATRDLGDDAWAALSGQFDARTCVEILMLVGHYDMLATMLRTLRVKPDEPRA
jgi:AhpD family alkylhydroperoxidase